VRWGLLALLGGALGSHLAIRAGRAERSTARRDPGDRAEEERELEPQPAAPR
jgi:hypothetical protein